MLPTPSPLSIVFFFLMFTEKSRGSKNNIMTEAGRGRCECDVKVRKKDIKEKKRGRRIK